MIIFIFINTNLFGGSDVGNNNPSWLSYFSEGNHQPVISNTMIFFNWVCLKIVYPIVPNGFADHYPMIKNG